MATDVDMHMESAGSNTPSTCGDSVMDSGGTDAAANAKADAMLWAHLAPCTSQQATQAVEIRAALTSKMGNQEAAIVLRGCRATVAKNTEGQKDRVLRAPTGDLLKLKE